MSETKQLELLKQQNEELRKALQVCGEKYRAVTRIAQDAIIIADQQGEIVSWNNAAQRIFGYSEEELLGQPLIKIIPQNDRGGHTIGMQRAVRTGKLRSEGEFMEFEGLRKDGTLIPVKISVSRWCSNGDVYFTGIVYDISAHKRMEQKLERLRHEYESFMRHELQNKITPIMGYAELLLNSAANTLNPEQKRYLNRIKEGVERTSYLIDNLKMLQDFELQKTQLSLMPYNLSTILETVVIDLEMMAREANVQLRFTGQEETGEILMDMNFLPGVFQNLIKNAIEHVEYLENRLDQVVTIQLSTSEHRIQVRINNKGLPIPPERLELFFEKFNSDPSKKGTGLGTSYAFLITKAHEGEIYVESNEKNGTTVTVTFPLVPRIEGMR